MEKITDYVTALIIARITGSITQSEEILLNNLLEKFPEVRALSDFLNEAPPPVNIPDRATLKKEARNIIKMAESRTEVTPESHTEPKRTNYRRLVVIAACMVVIIVTAVKLGRYHTLRQQSINAGRKDSVRVSLSMDGGTVLLPGNKLTIDPDKGLLIDDTYPLRALTNREKDLTATLRVPEGLRYALQLGDGSKASINSATELKFPLQFKEQQREVNVNGEAYFTVNANANRPFIVQLPNSKAIALGTQFNVNSYNQQQPRILLISGSVQVSSGNNTAQLKPGEAATGSGNRLEVGPMDKDETSWLHDEIYINDVSEKEVVALTWRYWRQKLTIARPMQANRINLIIDKRLPIDSFLIQLAPLDKIHQDSNGYRIER
jgi:hypothetical protein